MKHYDVVGIGNAIVDVISTEHDQFIDELGLARGAMTLIDTERAVELYAAMGPGSETSGGSAANTMAGVASFGGSAGFIGKVRNDQLGEVFRHDIRALGVDFDVAGADAGPSTARCLIVVTPDAARTMSTYLGIAGHLHPEDIDAELASAAKVLYCEGYIWDVDITKEAIRKAIEATKAAGNKISFTLSDAFCVHRHHAEWLELIDGTIDILFGNQTELAALTGSDDWEECVAAVQGKVEVACLTRSAEGSLIVTPDDRIFVPAAPVEKVVDTTGAGDLYAAGFLYGYTHGHDLATCGELASLAAAEVIGHLGARPLVSLAELAAPVLSRAAPGSEV